MIIQLNAADFSGNNINNMPSIPDEDIGGGGTKPFSQLMYKFGVLSDIHLYVDGLVDNKNNSTIKNYDNNNKFRKAIDFMTERGIEDVYIAGDIGYTAWLDGYDENCVLELQEYKSILTEKGQWQLNKGEEIYYPYHPVTGNHDSEQSDTNWNTYTGHDKNFVIEKDGDVFIGLSLPNGGSDLAPYNILDANEKLTGFIKEKLEEYAGRRIFLFMHYPIPGFSGLYFESAKYDYYGFSESSIEDNRLLEKILLTKNVVVFHGHTHFQFEFEGKCPEINASYFSNKNVALMHVPSCGYPRGDDEKPITSGKSQGYVVEVYTDGIKIIGADFINNKLLDEYTYSYLIPGDQSVISSKIKINASLDDSDAILEPEQEAKIKITLSKNLDTTLKVVATGEICIKTDEGEVDSTLINFDNNSREHTITIKVLENAVGGSAAINIMPNNEEDKDQFLSARVSVTITGKQEEEEILPNEATSIWQLTKARENSNSENPNELDADTGNLFGTKTKDLYDSDGEIKYQGDTSKIYQITNGDSEKDYLCLYQLYLNSSETPIYLGAVLDSFSMDVYRENIVNAHKTTGQRAMSSSATITYITGKQMDGDETKAVLKGHSYSTNKPCLKGNYIIENLELVVSGSTPGDTTKNSYANEGGIAGTSGTSPGSMTIKNNGTFVWNNATVQLVGSKNGESTLELKDARAGQDITYKVNSGMLTKVEVKIDEQPIEEYTNLPDNLLTLAMPGAGHTLIITPTFS